MRDDLFANIRGAPQQVRVDIACQQHCLEEEHTSGPDGCGPSQIWQHHLANHRLANEE